MSMTAEEVLAGPRGRHLCVAVAAALDGDVKDLAARLGFTGDRSDPMLVAELTAALGRVDLTRLSGDHVERALAASVNAARYWQEPEGMDQVAALSDVRAALEPIASAVVSSPVASGWSSPRTHEQWVVDWRGADDPAPVDRTNSDTLARWGQAVRENEARAARERSRDPRANWSGDWWSTPYTAAHSVGVIPRALDLFEDSGGWEVTTVIPVRGAGTTLEIRTADDWAALCREHPLDVTASRRHDWYRVTGRDGAWVIPDWEQVAQHWDAVHLTTAGYLSGATREIQVDPERASMIAGWNPDTTFWLTDVLREGEGPREYWRLDPESEKWVRETS